MSDDVISSDVTPLDDATSDDLVPNDLMPVDVTIADDVTSGVFVPDDVMHDEVIAEVLFSGDIMFGVRSPTSRDSFST